jgi:hypothetical protein
MSEWFGRASLDNELWGAFNIWNIIFGRAERIQIMLKAPFLPAWNIGHPAR